MKTKFMAALLLLLSGYVLGRLRLRPHRFGCSRRQATCAKCTTPPGEARERERALPRSHQHFAKHNMKSVGYWTRSRADSWNHAIYILSEPRRGGKELGSVPHRPRLGQSQGGVRGRRSDCREGRVGLPDADGLFADQVAEPIVSAFPPPRDALCRVSGSLRRRHSRADRDGGAELAATAPPPAGRFAPESRSAARKNASCGSCR